MVKFTGESRTQIAKKDINMKTPFKIEMSENEKKNKDKYEQSVYFTNKGPLIKLEEEDKQEMQMHQLKTIAEEGQRESSEEGDEDEFQDDEMEEDPDDDLDI